MSLEYVTDDEASVATRTNLLTTGATAADDVDEVAEAENEEADGAVRLAPTASSSPLLDLARFSFFGSAARRACDNEDTHKNTIRN